MKDAEFPPRTSYKHQTLISQIHTNCLKPLKFVAPAFRTNSVRGNHGWFCSQSFWKRGSGLRFSNGSTAIFFSGGGRNNSPFQTFQLTAAVKATSDAINAAIGGLRRTHFRAWVKSPLRLAWIGSCLSQCSRSSASARAGEYRRFGSFSRHLRQIVERSRSTFGFGNRGGRGSVSSSNLIVS
jgi:hypothetical protein